MDCLEVWLGHKNELANHNYLMGCISCNGRRYRYSPWSLESSLTWPSFILVLKLQFRVVLLMSLACGVGKMGQLNLCNMITKDCDKKDLAIFKESGSFADFWYILNFISYLLYLNFYILYSRHITKVGSGKIFPCPFSKIGKLDFQEKKMEIFPYRFRQKIIFWRKKSLTLSCWQAISYITNCWLNI